MTQHVPRTATVATPAATVVFARMASVSKTGSNVPPYATSGLRTLVAVTSRTVSCSKTAVTASLLDFASNKTQHVPRTATVATPAATVVFARMASVSRREECPPTCEFGANEPGCCIEQDCVLFSDGGHCKLKGFCLKENESCFADSDLGDSCCDGVSCVDGICASPTDAPTDAPTNAATEVPTLGCPATCDLGAKNPGCCDEQDCVLFEDGGHCKPVGFCFKYDTSCTSDSDGGDSCCDGGHCEGGLCVPDADEEEADDAIFVLPGLEYLPGTLPRLS